MQSPRQNVSIDYVRQELQNIVGRACWNVNSGEAVGTTFQLSFGEKIPRLKPLTNPTLTDEYRHNDGETNLLVWCSYRLLRDGAMVASDRTSEKAIHQILKASVLHSCPKIVTISESADLVIEFDNGVVVDIFANCIRCGRTANHWDIWTRKRGLFATTTGYCTECY